MNHYFPPDDYEKPPRRGFIGSVLHFVGQVLGWLFNLLPGLFFIAYGATGICTHRFKGGKMGMISYGDDAVGWGWIAVAFGLWYIGQNCAANSWHGVFKLIGWVVSIAVGAFGIWVLVRRYV